MKKIGNTQSGTLLVEMTDAEYEKLSAGVAVPVDAFMTMRMTVMRPMAKDGSMMAESIRNPRSLTRAGRLRMTNRNRLG